MANQGNGNRRSIAAFATAGIALIVVLGGTSYASSRPSHPAAASHTLTTGQIKSLIKTYVNKHVPKPVQFGANMTSTSVGGGPVANLGPWTLNMTCTTAGVGVGVTGPGEEYGANTIGTTDGGAGSSFETFGGAGGTNGAGPGNQASQTLILQSASAGYTITYMANADKSSPVNCTMLGYAIPFTD